METLAHLNAFERGRVMKRSQRAEALNLLKNFVGDERGRIEVISAVDDSVTYSVDFVDRRDGGALAMNQSVENDLQGFFVVCHVLGEDSFVLIGAMLE